MIRSSWFLMVLSCSLALVLGCPAGDDDAADDDAADDDAADDDGADDDTADDDAADDDTEPDGIKRLLFEEFTNTGCVPCADYNPLYDAFLEGVGAGNVIGVKVHADWPSSTDPWNTANPTDCAARIDYYQVDGVPYVIIDGQYPISWHGGNYFSDIATYFDVPLLADVAAAVVDLGDGDYTATCRVVATDALSGTRDVMLRAVATQIYLDFPTAVGSNSETEFHDTVTNFLPDGVGTALTLEAGYDESFSFDFTLPDDEYAEPDQLAVVCWVQDDATQEVLQAATSEAPPAPSFRIVESVPEGVIIEPTATASFSAWLENSGTVDADLEVELQGAAPQGWSLEWTLDGQAASGTEAVTLAPGEGVEILVDVDPASNSGWVPLVVHVQPQGDADAAQQMPVTVLTYGPDYLVVDADGDELFETYYTDSLDAYGATYVIWRSEIGLDTVDLSRFQAVIWNAGWYFPHFYEIEQTHLADFLDAGGKLFISGQDIGWDQCDAASNFSDSTDWYEANLHAEYFDDISGSLVVAGVAADPIGDGLAFDIDGGDGASNQAYPSHVEPLGPDADLILQYDNGEGAGVRALHGSGKVVYLAFGFEAIDSQASRDLLMARALDWLAL